ncbi:MAG: TetR/AcrR family transcriptional regulator [Frankia sp.]|nr:TetR/AcrR family transcriptional regulator [Frankia sp.]
MATRPADETGSATVPEPAGETVAPTRPGRPRRYPAEQERQLIFDAAFDTVRRKGYQDLTVADILTEAGLSTRSFYRHFSSKEDLLNALFLRGAERFAGMVAERVHAAGSPPAALTVWVDELLALVGGEGPRAERAAVLGSPAATRALDPQQRRRAQSLLVAPLTATIQAGVADGSMRSDDPDADAVIISTITWETAAQIRITPDSAEKAALRAQALSFIRRALRVADE